MDRGAWGGGYSPWGHKESNMTEQLSTQHQHRHETRQIYFAEFQLPTLDREKPAQQQRIGKVQNK